MLVRFTPATPRTGKLGENHEIGSRRPDQLLSMSRAFGQCLKYDYLALAQG